MMSDRRRRDCAAGGSSSLIGLGVSHEQAIRSFAALAAPAIEEGVVARGMTLDMVDQKVIARCDGRGASPHHRLALGHSPPLRPRRCRDVVVTANALGKELRDET